MEDKLVFSICEGKITLEWKPALNQVPLFELNDLREIRVQGRLIGIVGKDSQVIFSAPGTGTRGR